MSTNRSIASPTRIIYESVLHPCQQVTNSHCDNVVFGAVDRPTIHEVDIATYNASDEMIFMGLNHLVHDLVRMQ